MAKKNRDMLGSWSFLIGVILAVVLGAGFTGNYSGTVAWVLVVIGLLVGLLNVNDKEVQPFLLSGLALIIASALGASIVASIPKAGPIMASVLASLLIVFVPATIIVALKNVFTLSRN